MDDEEERQAGAETEVGLASQVRSFPERWVRSPNYSGADQFHPRGAIFHFTGYSLQSALNWLTKKESRASYHVIITPEGERVRLVDDRHRAWHAGGVRGSSRIQGQNPNGCCLGIAFTGNLYDGTGRQGLMRLTEAELESAWEFLALRWQAMGLELDYVSDHRTVDPTRRNDIPPAELARLVGRIREGLGA